MLWILTGVSCSWVIAASKGCLALQLLVGFPLSAGRKGTVDWDAAAWNCSTGSCFSTGQVLAKLHQEDQLEQLDLRNLSSMRASSRLTPFRQIQILNLVAGDLLVGGCGKRSSLSLQLPVSALLDEVDVGAAVADELGSQVEALVDVLTRALA
jgi:hypothetical protein